MIFSRLWLVFFLLCLYPVFAAASFFTPQHVALLVPLKGTSSKAGQAIAKGFQDAADQNTDLMKPVIDVVDTSQYNNIQQAYEHVIEQGADFIVGPLFKTDVQVLNQIGDLKVPVLALNYLGHAQSPVEHLYQFGLSPLDEARQAAGLARKNGCQSALVFVPQGEWGASIAKAFRDEWLALGGDVKGVLNYSINDKHFSDDVRRFLHFQQASKKSVPSRRQDFDMVFLAANPKAARIIDPLLKFYYVSDVPIYATSLVYSGKPSPDLDNDLNGIMFFDSPWVFQDNKEENSNSRLYALGLDAYSVALHLNDLENQEPFTGATGTLYLSSENRIVRKLQCVQFHDGTPILING